MLVLEISLQCFSTTVSVVVPSICWLWLKTPVVVYWILTYSNGPPIIWDCFFFLPKPLFFFFEPCHVWIRIPPYCFGLKIKTNYVYNSAMQNLLKIFSVHTSVITVSESNVCVCVTFISNNTYYKQHTELTNYKKKYIYILSLKKLLFYQLLFLI